MALHTTSGRWQFGLLLALVTAAMWATLPVALKITLEQVDPYTLTWFRFVVAFALIGAWLAASGGLGGFARLGRGDWILLVVAAAGLIGNYVLYLLGLAQTTPANAQLIIQLAPLLMALGGIFLFRERFAPLQWLGLLVVFGGLGLFFRDQLLGAMQAADGYGFGVLLIVLAAVVWAAYAMAQKQLLSNLSSPAILLFIYACASVVLLPTAAPASLLALDGLHWAALLYCAFNTLAAYGAFAEALAHWEASRVSVVLALTPLLTVACVWLTHALWPELIAPERIGRAGWLGAVMVVSGSALTSLGGRRRQA
jgi:drug/metabolite transporter (DMT)-like permease